MKCLIVFTLVVLFSKPLSAFERPETERREKLLDIYSGSEKLDRYVSYSEVGVLAAAAGFHLYLEFGSNLDSTYRPINLIGLGAATGLAAFHLFRAGEPYATQASKLRTSSKSLEESEAYLKRRANAHFRTALWSGMLGGFSLSMFVNGFQAEGATQASMLLWGSYGLMESLNVFISWMRLNQASANYEDWSLGLGEGARKPWQLQPVLALNSYGLMLRAQF